MNILRENIQSFLARPWRKLVVLLLAVLCGVLVSGLLVVWLTPAYAISAQTRELVRSTLAHQKEVDQAISAQIEAQSYSLQSPLVIQDPYETSPLTALVIFDTPQKTQISIHVHGKTPQADVDFTFAPYEQHHEIPIYGLYAAANNTVTIRAAGQDGTADQATLQLQTEVLPAYLETIQVKKADPAQYSSGFNFTALDHKIVFDINGDVRWYSTKPSEMVYTGLQNGHFLFVYGIRKEQNEVLMEEDLLGKVFAIYNVPNGIHHDVSELPNGNFIFTSQDPQSATIYDFIQEMDRKSGHILRSFDMKNYLDEARPREIGLTASDWLHLNSIVYDSADDSIVISARSQSAVIKFSYPEMKIQWILGPHDNWPPAYQPYLLAPPQGPQAENFDWQWSQHHATILNDTAPGKGIVDILLFDNGLFRTFDAKNTYTPLESYSRIVRYQVDEQAKTVKQVWEYGKERASELFSVSRGSVYLLANGDYFGDFAEILKDAQGNPILRIDKKGSRESRLLEVNPTTGGVVFEASIKDTPSYRVARGGFYDRYAESSDLLSTSIRDTSASDLQDRLQMLSIDAPRWEQYWLLSLKRFARRILK